MVIRCGNTSCSGIISYNYSTSGTFFLLPCINIKYNKLMDDEDVLTISSTVIVSKVKACKDHVVVLSAILPQQ